MVELAFRVGNDAPVNNRQGPPVGKDLDVLAGGGSEFRTKSDRKKIAECFLNRHRLSR